MKIVNYHIILTLVLLFFVLPTNSFAESLMGQVLDKRGVPITGMEVRLYHPKSGLSRPRYTNYEGVFFFDFVPAVRGNYDIEYYWKGQLIYRGSVFVQGNVRLQPIRL